MTPSPQRMPRRRNILVPRARVQVLLTLAAQRARQTWRMLFVTGLGMVCAVMLVCAVLVYSKVAMTAGMRDAFQPYAQNGDIVVRTLPRLISSQVIKQATQRLDNDFQRDLGPYLAPPQLSIQTQGFTVLTQDRHGSFHPAGTPGMMFIGSETDQAGAHMQMVQGRLPRATSGGAIEIAVKLDTASELKHLLGVTVGSVLYVRTNLWDGTHMQISRVLTVHLVGIFQLSSANDPFWHGQDFSISLDGYSVLASNTGILSALDRISQDAAARGAFFAASPIVLWYYRPDTDRITIDDLDAITGGIQNAEIDISNDPSLEHIPYLEFTQAYVPYDVLAQFRSSVSTAQVVVFSFLALLLGLVLFFVTTMADLLVDRQSDTVAILRSRGASRRQVFGALVIQAVVLGLVALVIGPLLALFVAYWVAHLTIAPADQGALQLITLQPVQVMLEAGRFALIAACVTFLAMILTLWRATSRDVLALRREAARSTYRPLWQRFHLDGIACVIALVSFGVVIYLSNASILTTRLRLLLLSPLTLFASVFLLLAGLLILLRFFLRLLRLLAVVAVRSRSAAPLLALAQMARAPRYSIRTALLLALASALAIFTLIFGATQVQHVRDVANYRAGADFSGVIPTALYTPEQLESETAVYQHIAGVTSAALGFTAQARAGGTALSIPIDFKAVDASAFARTAIWTAQDSSQSLTSLMQALVSQRSSAIAQQVVPAIVDSNTWNALHLSPGAPFILNFGTLTSMPVNFKVIAQVQHIPTPGDSSVPGVMTDYRTFAAVYTHNFTTASDYAIPLNYAWLRTKDDDASLASVRKAINTLPTLQDIVTGTPSSLADLRLAPLYDRRAMLATLEHEPLYLSLVGALTLGAATALLLALLGSLLASLLQARSRLTNFAVLRAIGATPHQIASMLTWEQGVIYSTSVLLGIACGALLSALVLPILTFTNVLPSQIADQITGTVSSAEFYAAQNAPSIQIIIPPSLSIAVGILAAICMLVLGTMIYTVSRPSIQQVLRLNED